MKKFLCILLLLTSLSCSMAQNPVSYPKDTTISAPELNFEVLWLTFENNYAFFKLRHIDWHQAYDLNRSKITPTISNDSLYHVLCRMLAPFEDNHVNLIIPHLKQFKSVKPSQFVKEFPSDSLREGFLGMVNTDLIRHGFDAIRYAGPKHNGQPLFAWTSSKQIGYLRFNRCFVDPDAENIPDAKVASAILDSIFLHFSTVEALIVDVRDNVGGNDEFAYAVAGRFVLKKITGMSVRTRVRGGGYEDFGPAKKTAIIPNGHPRFNKPIVVLTNDKTVSAGDVFAVLMSELPNTRLIGSNTRGIYSDMYGFTLPNGWLVSLSNQRYYNNKGICYEGTGTPVDIKILNTIADLTSGTDPVLRRALQYLKK